PWHRGANGPRPSTPRDGGLDRLAPSAGMADAARSKPVVAAEFAQSARNGVAIQAGDTRHQGDATIPLLLGQQGDQLATTMLISPSDQSVDGAMVLCRDAVRMLSAGRARAAVQFHRGVLLAHWCSSPCPLWQEDSSIAILPKPAEVIFAHRLSITGIHGISPAPSRPALVVLHHDGHFLVDRPCPLFIGRQSFRCPDSKLSDRAIQEEQWLWSQMSS